MSASVEDEARARLDVAQLYEDMNQMPKAIRYYLEAAQIYRQGGLLAKAKDLLEKVLQLEPGNAQAELEIKRLSGGQAQAAAAAATAAAAPPPPPPAAGASLNAVPAAPPRKPGNQLPPLQLPQPQAGKVLIPTPWLFRDPRYVQAAKKQLTQAVDRNQLPFDPLPSVDPQMVMLKQEQRRKAEAEAARKANPRVESAFANRESPFAKPAATGGSILQQGRPSGPAAPAAPGAPAPGQPTPQPSRFGLGGARSGNQDLAEQIRRRLQEKKGG